MRIIDPLERRGIENPTFRSIDEAQLRIFKALLDYGDDVTPRGMRTLEISPFSFTLLNPRLRCTTLPDRKWSMRLAVGELAWHLSGSNDLDFISHYAPRWRNFSDDGVHINGSAYGKKIFCPINSGASQWDRALSLLRSDPHTRRAIISFFDPHEGDPLHSNDISCTIYMQFFIRSGSLHSHVCMRSNDVIRGLPYDIFLFTMLQELMASTLGLCVGEYHHTVGSMHVYEHHFELLNHILAAPALSEYEMPPLDTPHDVQNFLILERNQRLNQENKNVPIVSKYWSDLLEVANIPFGKQQKLDVGLSDKIRFSPYWPVLAPILSLKEF